MTIGNLPELFIFTLMSKKNHSKLFLLSMYIIIISICILYYNLCELRKYELISALFIKSFALFRYIK